MSDKKEKLEKENIESEENKLNGDSVDQAIADNSETDETIGTPSYEELFDKNEELEKLLLRANEDKEGIALTLKSFESTLDKFGMIPIYPINEEFNPEKHEAVSMEQDKNKKDGYVGNIFQRGWELHSRVLRPARVTVIKN